MFKWKKDVMVVGGLRILMGMRDARMGNSKKKEEEITMHAEE